MFGFRHGMRSPFGGRTGRWGWGSHDSADAELAQELDITVEQLRAARRAAWTKRIEKAVAEGELAPKRAERMLAWQKLQNAVDMPQLIARALDMSPEEVQAALASGKSPGDLLDEKGMDVDTAMQKLRAAGREALDQAVADGVISQAEADAIVRRRGRGPMAGPFGWGPRAFGCGHGRFGGPWGGPWRSRQSNQDEFLGPPAVI